MLYFLEPNEKFILDKDESTYLNTFNDICSERFFMGGFSLIFQPVEL